MKYESLPYEIKRIRRTRLEIRIIAVLLAIVAIIVAYKSMLLVKPLRSVMRPFQSEQIVSQILFYTYLVIAISSQEAIRNYLYRRFGNFSEDQFIKVLEGIWSSKWPIPRVVPVRVAIIARCLPVLMVCVLPGFVFHVLGLYPLQFVSMVAFLLYLGDVASAIYYIAFWDRNMIEYVKPGVVLGINYFDTYFFPKEQTEGAEAYIRELKAGQDLC